MTDMKDEHKLKAFLQIHEWLYFERVLDNRITCFYRIDSITGDIDICHHEDGEYLPHVKLGMIDFYEDRTFAHHMYV